MSIIMLGFMLKMHTNKKLNTAIFGGSLALSALGVWLVRSQETIGDVAWMKAMIPHHSIAILTSERAGIKDPRVRKLADGIISTQRKEIADDEGVDQRLGKQKVGISQKSQTSLTPLAARVLAAEQMENRGTRRECPGFFDRFGAQIITHSVA